MIFKESISLLHLRNVHFSVVSPAFYASLCLHLRTLAIPCLHNKGETR